MSRSLKFGEGWDKGHSSLEKALDVTSAERVAGGPAALGVIAGDEPRWLRGCSLGVLGWLDLCPTHGRSASTPGAPAMPEGLLVYSFHGLSMSRSAVPGGRVTGALPAALHDPGNP